jgi:2-polyprenyl-3-methyl-5-hydroxy-6-metoxy-1,4-benzoquinol methylase
MINEAVYTLYEGVGSVSAIDTAMKLGANHPMGPLELADFIGLDTCLSIMHVLYDGLVDSVFRVSRQAWTIRRCLRCGSAHLNPRPGETSMAKAYARYYTHDASSVDPARATGSLRSVKRMLANGYRNHRFGTRFQPALRIGAILLAGMPRLRGEVERSMRNLPRLPPGGRLLDVGFGNAAFLLRARSGGWSVAGVDADSVVVEKARRLGLEVRKGGMEAYEDAPAGFDVITLANVLEHLHDPGGALRKAFALLKPGGYLWLDTPNIEGPVHALFGRYWRGLEPPRHLAIFNRSSLMSLLTSAGFVDIEDIPQARGVIRQRILASLDIVDQEVSNHRVRQRYRQAAARVRSLETRALKDPSAGDSLTFRCRKADPGCGHEP